MFRGSLVEGELHVGDTYTYTSTWWVLFLLTPLHIWCVEAPATKQAIGLIGLNDFIDLIRLCALGCWLWASYSSRPIVCIQELLTATITQEGGVTTLTFVRLLEPSGDGKLVRYCCCCRCSRCDFV